MGCGGGVWGWGGAMFDEEQERISSPLMTEVESLEMVALIPGSLLNFGYSCCHLYFTMENVEIGRVSIIGLKLYS